MKIINPANGEVIKEIKEDTPREIEEKFEKASNAWSLWRETAMEGRINSIDTFAKKLRENREELANQLTAETGKPFQESINEINGAIKKIQFFINESLKTLSPKEVNVDGNTREVLAYDPLGVIANISAWNYPYLVGINIFVPALIAGNCVLYKPSEFATLTGLSIEKLLHDSGIPNDVFIACVGAGEVGKKLLELPLAGYFFTGSYATGKKIAEAVVSRLVPVGLELGGKDPVYITDEIKDIKSAAVNAVEGVFYNNGQSCCSIERIYVHENVYDDFLEHFVKATKAMKVGDPTNPENTLGAITRKEHLTFLQSLVDDAINKGAELIVGGNIIESSGNFFEPTVLTNVNHTMDVMVEETFGPVIGIMKVKNDEEAIHLMNDTKYGLTSAVFSDDQERGKYILSRLNSGSGYLNCCDRVSGYLPWSGRGHSGLGSTLSIHGLYAFTNPKGYHLRA